MIRFIATWGRSVLNGHLLHIAEQDDLITMAYIRGVLNTLDVAYMINERRDGYVDIRVDCSDTMYEIIMNKINKYYLDG